MITLPEPLTGQTFTARVVTTAVLRLLTAVIPLEAQNTILGIAFRLGILLVVHLGLLEDPVLPLLDQIGRERATTQWLLPCLNPLIRGSKHTRTG